MKKYALAAVLAASAASADAAVVYNFSGAEYGGAAVSGSITIDTAALAGANGTAAPALDYYFATGDGGSNVASPFLTISFTSAGTNPALLGAGDFTFQWLHADPSDMSLELEFDWQFTDAGGMITASRFALSGFNLSTTQIVDGALLPDFSSAGTLVFNVQSGTGPFETYDVNSIGEVTFSAAAPAPEAATWAMMVLGFGAVGYAARRRSRIVFAA